MRITGGELGGRRVAEPPGRVRPTQDRVREAVFSSLAALIPDARVLDLYAGAGTLGLEAWSRGAAEVCWVELDPRVSRVLQANVDTLCSDKTRPARVDGSDVFRFLSSRRAGEAYDVILADPPYATRDEESHLPRLLEAIRAHAVLKPGGLLVFEQSHRLHPVESDGWTLIRDKRYGEARILMYQRAP